MATPESWHNHAEVALRRERYVVRNARGEPVRGGLLPTDGIVVTGPDETAELVLPEAGGRVGGTVGMIAHAYTAGWDLGLAEGRRGRDPFLPILALIAGAVIGFALANLLGLVF